MTLLDDAPAQLVPARVRPGELTTALTEVGTGAALVLLALPADPHLQTRAEEAVRRECRTLDRVVRPCTGELVVVLAVPDADLDALADRLLSVVERATGEVAAAGVCVAAGRHDPLGLARAGLAVAWACGGSRAVRHP